MAVFKLKKWYNGCYRTPSVDGHFAQIKKSDTERGWLIEIRRSDSGDLKRYAGIWKTLKEANEEAVRVLGAI